MNSILTKQEEGTSIGLYLVKVLVKALGNTISVESKVEDENDIASCEFLDNRLIQSMSVEFSNIYF